MQTQVYERINIIIPKETAKRLRSTIPRGQRSKIIAEAIDEKIHQLNHRENSYQELLRIRKKGPKVSLDQVAQWIKEDRQSH